jgi:hypothetical protein
LTKGRWKQDAPHRRAEAPKPTILKSVCGHVCSVCSLPNALKSAIRQTTTQLIDGD